ncbi:hypothetical protein J2W35_003280 [Variovorax boronicumulans]|uniref:hypothetical protein n=1 Tax=Variovorax boronicumulans TaxID=436515 RepID=UPI002784BD92|nr:hypothetical protein [Variovorax boronicumulans]MDQ0082921.1 hypothetical protein [Variovorax boronicumulans]
MRKQCRRRHYALTNPITLAIAGACITDDGRLDKLRLLELSAIDAFARGAATVDDWRTVADLTNLAQTMCEMGIGPEVLPAAQKVEEVLGDAHQRFMGTGRMGTTGPGLQAMRDLQEWHHLQRTAIARSVYERAIERTHNRIRSAHPSVKVCVV